MRHFDSINLSNMYIFIYVCIDIFMYVHTCHLVLIKPLNGHTYLFFFNLKVIYLSLTRLGV